MGCDWVCDLCCDFGPRGHGSGAVIGAVIWLWFGLPAGPSRDNHRKITGFTGKSQENHRKITGFTGKSQENHRRITGKSQKNHRRITGKSQENHRKITG